MIQTVRLSLPMVCQSTKIRYCYHNIQSKIILEIGRCHRSNREIDLTSWTHLGRSPGSVRYLHSTSSHKTCYQRKFTFQTKAFSDYANYSNPNELFWKKAAEDIVWFNCAEGVTLDRSNPPFYRWFPDRILNTCFNCLDRHVNDGLGDQNALIYDSPVTNTIKYFTFNQLLVEVMKLSKVLTDLGVRKGDRVIIYMPNIPESVVSMLACARIGAVHSVVFGGFAAPGELDISYRNFILHMLIMNIIIMVTSLRFFDIVVAILY